ncbi:MAG: fibronectin type III domain-containing protein, partial [bacterium]
MRSRDESIRVKYRIRVLILIGIFIGNVLGWFPFTTTLRGYPTNAKAHAITASGGAPFAPTVPAKPGGLTAATVSKSQINLVWADSANNEDGFKIERKTGVAGNYVQIATAGANVTTFSNVSGLSPNTEYFYRVRAHNTGGHSAYSSEANATTLPNVPTAPSSLTASAVSNSQINLVWTDNSNNEQGFKIERTTGAADTYAEIATIGANVTSYSNTGLSPNTEYFYRVRAYNAGGHSDYSNEANATTLPTVPAKPGGLTAAAVSNTKINLAWVDSSNNEAGFKIERKISQGGTGTYAQIVPQGGIDANVTGFIDSSLAAKTTYFYRLRAFNAGGHSGYSNPASTTTLPNPPATPSSLTAVAVSHSAINLTWVDNSNNENGFNLERKIGAAGTYVQIATVGVNIKSYVDTGLATNTEYFYRIRAHNAGGHSAYSNEANATTLPTVPAKPGGLTAAAVSNTKINLAWVDSSNNEAGFKIERKTAAGTYAQIVPQGGIGANVTGFIDSSLAAKTTYFYRLRAFNAGGHSGYSNSTIITTLPNPPDAPSNLTATVAGSSQINLTWLDNAGNENGFKIESKIGETGTYTEIASVGANATSYSNTGLIEDAPYFYRARAANTGGYSAYSNEVNAAPSDDTNLALKKPVFASSTDTASATGRAVDGNLTTFWNSGSVNPGVPLAWLRVRLSASAPVTIDRAVIKWHQTYFAKEYDIQVSNDGASWTTVYTNNAGTIDTQEMTFAPTSARLLRLYMRKNNKPSYRVAELEVYFGVAKARGNAAKGDVVIPETISLAQ